MGEKWEKDYFIHLSSESIKQSLKFTRSGIKKNLGFQHNDIKRRKLGKINKNEYRREV